MASRRIEDLNSDMVGMARVHVQLCEAKGIQLMKVCTVCDVEKTVGEFNKKRSGRNSQCKLCQNIYTKQWYLKNKAQLNAKQKEYRQNNSKKVIAGIADWRIRNPGKCAEYTAKYRVNNSEKVRKATNVWGTNNKETKLLAYRTWAKNNPDVIRERNVRRKAAKLQAIPSWFGEFDIFVYQEANSLARLRTAATGILHHVDHKVPLVSQKVCGLHCAANFAVIPASENLSKGNRYWEDM